MKQSSFIFKENHVFIEEDDNPLDKVVTVEEELDGIDIDGIGNLVDLHRLMFIDEEYGNVKIVLDGRQLTITERGNQKFYKPIDVHSVTNAIDEIQVSMIFCGYIFLWVGSK